MAVTIVSKTTFSVLANIKSVDQVTGQYENVGKGKIILAILTSATGLNVTLSIGGITVVNDQPVPWFGTTGGLSLADNVMVAQELNGGKVEMFLRNTTGGTLTADFQLMFEPS